MSYSSIAIPRTSRLSPFEMGVGTSISALALLLLTAHAAPAHEFKIGDLEIGHPWSRAVPTGAKVAGGYFTIINHGSEVDRLLSVSSEISDKAELDEMAVKDGVMTMQLVPEGIEIPADGKVALAYGGYHLMFVGLKQQPKLGQKFSATLTFQKTGSVTVNFLVQEMEETAELEDAD